jgi:hypothetical protein
MHNPFLLAQNTAHAASVIGFHGCYCCVACRFLFVDEVNRLLLVSTADKSAYLYDLAAGAVPLAR